MQWVRVFDLAIWVDNQNGSDISAVKANFMIIRPLVRLSSSVNILHPNNPPFTLNR